MTILNLPRRGRRNVRRLKPSTIGRILSFLVVGYVVVVLVALALTPFFK